MRLRLDADAIAQLVRLALPKRGLAAADAPMVFHARGAGFEIVVDVDPVNEAPGSPDENPLKRSFGPLAEIVEQAREAAIARALLATGGNRLAAARLLQVNPRTVFRHCERQR